MSFVAAATSVGAWALGTGAAAGIGSTIVGGAMIGAGVGGAYSALTGDGKILDSMLTGAGIGGLAGGVGGALFPGAAGYAAPATVGGVGSTTGQIAAASNTPAVAATANINPATGLSWEATGSGLSAGAGSPTDPSWWSGLSGGEKLGYGLGATTLLGMLGGQQQGIATQGDKGMIRPYEYSTARREPEAGQSYYFEPIEYDKYGKTTKPINTAERNYFDQKFTALPTYEAANGGQVPPNLNRMPAGGLASLQGMRDGYGATQTMDGNIPQFALGGFLSRAVGLTNAKPDNVAPRYSFDPATRKYIELNQEQANAEDDLSQFSPLNKGLFGNVIRQVVGLSKQSQQPDNKVRYDASTQRYENFAAGGHLGGYSDGGQLLKGPGDGVSDSIPASINEKQPARLADGEFVIPARIVSELGNGSTDAGAKRLYGMMDRVQADRSKTTGKGNVAVDSKARKHLLA